MVKKWYKSLTLGANVLVVLGVIAQVLTNTSIIDTDLQVALLGIINILIRTIKTKTKLVV